MSIGTVINVIDKDGHFHQIFQNLGLKRYNPSKQELDNAKSIVAEHYPNYKRAKLIVMHYDKNNYNDKSKGIEL